MINSDSSFVSPLKRTGSERPLIDPASSKAKRRVNFSGDDIEIRVEVVGLNAIYRYDFKAPFTPSYQDDYHYRFNQQAREEAVRDHNAKMEGLETQVQEIENVLESLNQPRLTQMCRERILRFINSDDHELKMAELGMILFFLDSQKAIPNEDSLLAFRAGQIEKQVESYISNHREKNLDPLIPTGKTHYMMRAFAHMVLTSSQVYNRGGLFAIKSLLMNPRCKISVYLQPEHRIHILNIVNQLLTDKSFDALFKRDVRVHESLEDVVRMDLKFPLKATIHSVHVFYACIMSLFADIRQIDTPNCYAVGSLIYAMENHTYTTLEKLIQSLVNGNCCLGPGEEVPLDSLLKIRLSYSDDLDLEVKANNAQESVILQHIHQILELNSVSFPHNHKLKLGDLLHSNLLVHRDSEKKEYAERVYRTFKSSALVDLQLAKIESIYMNSEKEGRDKRWVIESMITAIEARLPNRCLPKDFRRIFRENLDQILWLENCNERDIRFDKGILCVGTKRLQKFKGNIMKLDPLFKRSLRLFSLSEDFRGEAEYQMIWSMTELCKVLSDVFKQTEKELSYEANHAHLNQMAQKVIQSQEFKNDLCEMASRQIGKELGITGKELSDADLLIFNQTGGQEVLVLEEVYGIRVATKKFDKCETPHEFLENLLQWIREGNLARMRTVPKLLIATESYHTWTLAPSCWSLLQNHRNDLHGFINEVVFYPTDQRLFEEIIPAEIRMEVIHRFTNNEAERRRLKQITQDKGLTFGGFRDKLFESIHARGRAILSEIIEEEYSMVRLSPEELSDSLRLLSLNYDEDVINSLFRAVGNGRALSFVLAKKLQRALIREGKIIIDPYQLELAICHVKNLPLTICLGDSNWITKNTEDPEHPYIVIRTSWVTSNARYCIRDGDREYFESNYLYRFFDITFPK